MSFQKPTDIGSPTAANYAQDEARAEPLYALVRKIRKPASYRELIATCLRSVYMGDPFSQELGALPPVPKELIDEVRVNELTIKGLRCVIYESTTRAKPSPLILYMHGGGFVIGCSEDMDYVTRKLAHMNHAVVISVNYSLAPEAMFPVALNECASILSWALEEHDQLEIDIKSVFLCGDSAGGNLTTALAQTKEANDIKGQILLAPWLDMHVESYDSYNRLAPKGLIFDAAFLGYARGAYTVFEEWKHPQVSPIFFPAEKMPPTLALIGTSDPLHDQVLKLKQQAAQCPHVEVVVYRGMPHCFYALPGLFSEELDCFEKVAAFIGTT